MAAAKAMSRPGAKRRGVRLTRRARRRPWGVGALLVLVAGVSYLAWNYGWSGVAGVGDPAPVFALQASDGQQVSLGDHLGRRPVVLVFYMTYG